MPAIIPFIPLIAAGIGGTTAGLQLSGAGTGTPQKDAAAALQKQEQQQSAQDALARQKAIQAGLPDAQSQTGGDVNNPTLVDLSSIIAGIPGSANSAEGKNALAAFLGNPTAPQENLVSSTFGISGGQG